MIPFLHRLKLNSGTALPREEQQGYVQNALGYFNLIINFIIGLAGQVSEGMKGTFDKGPTAQGRA